MKRKAFLSGVLFYGILLIIVASAFFLTRGDGQTGAPRRFLNFSALRILTTSMEPELPRDALIIIQGVDPREIMVGDDITFLVSETSTVTHRVVQIIEDYADTGERGFQTRGIANPRADSEIVRATNVAGRVIWSNLYLGQFMIFVREYVLYIGAISVLLLILISTLRVVFQKKEREAETAKEQIRIEKAKAKDRKVESIVDDIVGLLQAE